MFAFLLSTFFTYMLCNAGTWVETGNTLYPIMDVGITVPNATYSTELASSGSWVVMSSDLGKSWKVLEETNDGAMDISASSLDSMTGVVASVMGRVVYSTDGGKTWDTAIDPLFGSQSIQRSRDGSKMYCGAGGDKISISTDKGMRWSHYAITGLTNGSRYCALPSSKVWYVSAGFWVEDDAYDNDDDDYLHLTSKIMLNKKTGDVSFPYIDNYGTEHRLHDLHRDRRRLQEEIMWGEIWKTSDAGTTWTRQYSSDNKEYFNGIDCCDDTHCIAVSEGDSESGSSEPGSRIYVTNDGKTWNMVWYNSNDASSMMTCHCVSDMEMYAGGGDIESGRGFDGHFVYTTDGGKTWSNTTLKAPVMWMDMTDDGQYGVGSGISKTSGGVEYGFS